MKSARLIVSLFIGLVILATACSPQATPTQAAIQPTQHPAATSTSAPVVPVTGGAAVDLGQNEPLGSFLVDDKGMTLYLFTKDTPNTSVCYDKCATAWPPLLTTGAPVAGEGLDASKLSTTTRTDGSVQATYNGWPLYYYASDTAPDDAMGQGMNSVWFLVSPTGEAIQQ